MLSFSNYLVNIANSPDAAASNKGSAQIKAVAINRSVTTSRARRSQEGDGAAWTMPPM